MLPWQLDLRESKTSVLIYQSGRGVALYASYRAGIDNLIKAHIISCPYLIQHRYSRQPRWRDHPGLYSGKLICNIEIMYISREATGWREMEQNLTQSLWPLLSRLELLTRCYLGVVRQGWRAARLSSSTPGIAPISTLPGMG